MEQLTSTVRNNADTARVASDVADAASRVATDGGAVVARVVQTMAEIEQASQKIADITGVIDGIAFCASAPEEGRPGVIVDLTP